jgi:hypothetical protein
LFPAFDFSFILLQRASLGFLRGPFQAVHQATYVGAVISDSELPLDYLSNADRGPEIRPVTLRDRSLKKERTDRAQGEVKSRASREFPAAHSRPR